MIYRTRNSTYEVDEALKLIRRVEGENAPLAHFGKDGEWIEYDTLFTDGRLTVLLPDGMWITTSSLQEAA